MSVRGNLFQRLKLKGRRAVSTYLERRVVCMQNQSPLVSFSFDDFPRSACTTGGAVLGEYGIKGTYFASFGLMGRIAPTGEIFNEDDLNEIVGQGHEIGCHTYDHCHSWDTPGAEFEASILRNRDAHKRLLAGACATSLSYPISCPRAEIKRRVGKYFDCCRGGGQTFNAAAVDLNFVKACFLEQTGNNMGFIINLIEANNDDNGWLIFVTHDISNTPTEFGCTPAFFEQVVKCASRSGAAVVTIAKAFERIRGIAVADTAIQQRSDINRVSTIECSQS